ncbi:hypothetical protein MKK88_04885 [Methylobacterium sp. E-005]|uniref:hypothetical protein n=1 Tax=Methylobacterium sp. E-005 TaxID=2836549 RepID=UPI001FBB5701|nr:hypothetical protein [Methylobacterium sp. E-005]MCJ2085330.1 hypothetical protein [Methylobacterium sp. E-005]
MDHFGIGRGWPGARAELLIDAALDPSDLGPDDRGGVPLIGRQRSFEHLKLLGASLRFRASPARLTRLAGLDIGDDNPGAREMKVDRLPRFDGLDAAISISVSERLVAGRRDRPSAIVRHRAAVTALEIRFGEASALREHPAQPAIVRADAALGQTGDVGILAGEGTIEAGAI